ncbi:MAG: alpha/beta hydrolase-fold protein [Bacteroidota bacterium]
MLSSIQNLSTVFVFAIALLLMGYQAKPAPTPPETLERLQTFTFENSAYIKDKTYQVMLPANYQDKSNKSYPVIYMMDCQNLFFDSLSYSKHAWRVDQVLDSLIEQKETKAAIIVGINNAGTERFLEYMPQAPVESLPQAAQDSLASSTGGLVFSDQFLQFLTKELKPLIDETFRTLPDQENTIIAGSSMGGLISMYAGCEYPEVFGTSLCLSTHWPIAMDDSAPIIPASILGYFTEKLPQHHRWYFDYGTEGLDQYYEKYQLQVDSIARAAGYNAQNYYSQKFDGHDHNEASWYSRLALPLTFALAVD